MAFWASVGAAPAFYAFIFAKQYPRKSVYPLGVMAPAAFQAATFEINHRSYAAPVMQRISRYIEDTGFF
jgi:uncharacterized protein YozE (UPF0346 family)